MIGMADMSLMQEICQTYQHLTQGCHVEDKTYHLETLVRICPCLFSGRCINARLLAGILCGLQDLGNSGLEFWIEFAQRRMADVVTQIIRADEDHVDTFYSRNLVDLLVSV